MKLSSELPLESISIMQEVIATAILVIACLRGILPFAFMLSASLCLVRCFNYPYRWIPETLFGQLTSALSKDSDGSWIYLEKLPIPLSSRRRSLVIRDSPLTYGL
jgi:hypothetical protein